MFIPLARQPREITKMKSVSVLFLIALFIQVIPTAKAEEWRIAKSDFGIDVEYRYPAGSSWRAFRGQVEVAAKPDKVVRFLQDLDSLASWHYRTRSAEVIKMEGMTSALVHIVTKPTWPVKQRDVVCRVELTVEADSDVIHISMESVDEVLPPSSNAVRMEKLEAKWKIEPSETSGSRVTYETYVEPGGSLPRWLFNNLAMDVPLFSLLNLRRYFEL